MIARRRLRLSVFIPCLIVTGFLVCVVDESNSQNTYDGPTVGVQCFQSSDPDVRIRECTKAINANIADLAGVGMQGMAGSLRVQRNDSMGKDYLINAYYNRATAYSTKKDYDHAIGDFNQVLRMDPENWYCIQWPR